MSFAPLIMPALASSVLRTSRMSVSGGVLAASFLKASTPMSPGRGFGA